MHLRVLHTLLAAIGLTLTALGSANAQPTLTDAIAAGRPVIDLRARYENVDDAGKTQTVGKPARSGPGWAMRPAIGTAFPCREILIRSG